MLLSGSRSQHLEILELKPWADAAAHQAVLPFRAGCLPVTCPNGVQRLVK